MLAEEYGVSVSAIKKIVQGVNWRQRGGRAMLSGEGPHGTLYVLRLCGFPEGDADARGATALERTVFGARTFFLRRGAGGVERIGR